MPAPLVAAAIIQGVISAIATVSSTAAVIAADALKEQPSRRLPEKSIGKFTLLTGKFH